MKGSAALWLLLLGGAFAGGLAWLFMLRFAAGDIYPPYSSLRADPLGTKALFHSVGRLVAAERNFRPHLPAGEGQGTTLVLAGLEGLDARYAPEDLKEVEDFAAAGGRVVVAFAPQFSSGAFFRKEESSPGSRTNQSPSRAEGKKPAASRKKILRDEEEPEMRSVTLGQRWKFTFRRGPAEKDERGVYRPVTARCASEGPLPRALSWHSAVWFEQADPAWKPVYLRDREQMLAMERRWGAGTIVLLTDSYYLSNQALRADRQPELLAWLMGPNRRVIFDETHLGVQEEPGLATLARRYRMHGLLAALLGLAALYVWRTSAPFLPPLPEAGAAGSGAPVQGLESAAGFVNLLRRNLRSADVFSVCFEEWRRSCGRSVSPDKVRRMQAVADAQAALPALQRDPVRAFRQCCAILEVPNYKSSKR